MTGTPREPEGTQLVTQLGEVMGGPEVPADPETETTDLRRKVWNAERLGQSWAMEDGTRREDGVSLLAVLGDAVLPVAAVLDRDAVREIVRMAIGKGWNTDDHPAAERVTEAVWPLLEHAQAALNDNEGVRLWMLDCGELVAKHRERAEAAEGKLDEIYEYCRTYRGDEGMTLACDDILAITGTEGDRRDG